MPTEAQFYEALYGFLPEGLIWPDISEDANLNTLIRHIANYTKAVDDAATAEFDDVFPDNTTGYLDDWERLLELPKQLTTVALFRVDINAIGDPLSVTTTTAPTASNNDERRNLINVMLKRNPLNNAAFYEEIAAVFGYTITVTTGVDYLEWAIDITVGDAAKLDIFTAMVNFFKPAHTQVTITGP